MARRIRNALLVVLALLVAAGAVFYFRPFAVIVAAQRLSMRWAGIKSLEVKLPAGRVHYLVLGEGRPLVLVHGFAGSAENWFHLMTVASHDGFKVYALDLLGFGKSDKPDIDYAISSQVEVLKQFLDSQNLQKVELAGISMGGWVSLSFARSSPERVERLVLFDSAGMAFTSTVDLRKALRPKTPEDFDELQRVIAAKPRKVPAFIVRDALRMFAGQDRVLERAMDSMGSGRDLLDGKLENVRMPVLLVWGKQDILVPLSVGEAMHREMPQSELKVFDGCGHYGLSECQADFEPAAMEFLKAQPAQP